MKLENSADVVRSFLRAQNYEQVGKIDEAIELYEAAVEVEFDSSGPYDRLIHLYADMARHHDVVRVAEAAIAKVHTYEDKKAWYEQMRAAAIKAQANVPRAAPKTPQE
jgi:tetratricopeptide (TPR) repeat protein